MLKVKPFRKFNTWIFFFFMLYYFTKFLIFNRDLLGKTSFWNCTAITDFWMKPICREMKFDITGSTQLKKKQDNYTKNVSFSRFFFLNKWPVFFIFSSLSTMNDYILVFPECIHVLWSLSRILLNYTWLEHDNEIFQAFNYFLRQKFKVYSY